MLTLLPEQSPGASWSRSGRLDHDTTGVLLMSDDGPFIHALSSPKRNEPKISPVNDARTGRLGRAIMQTVKQAEAKQRRLCP